ncbi:DUF3325 domain-containing protein [Acinetobacter lwoffii]|jgi:Protein of unknown function (DUF3325)|uniref:DUF3325 domain-containing protein n=1 Tax=Acinetobacter lwoffii NCTC 5866 = CIP 64.10 = NIPH 512 TaxID=981327 RepID=A0ABP2ZH04_ACILW|nr:MULTISPECIES: DUF3325 domain-containing protein [Acinetobacter]AUC07241.1 DUF3325 domain-containing protein [Acinetobacter lwoffii]ENU17383.1 hypothetical protein F995_01006 [Acinetobacter sp. CIP A162]ESJ96818.1 hypothetical protein P800_01645 [Acinetobacter lwoffii NCTC 5866 = CIP 64.10 = NIPH 512]QXB39742.1 DUF3325 domain-containing protein [Acinetobacter lwoffii]SUU36005.1 Protein of uncharacterised function (DUF3325) [Acinetobacter lwoffii]
MMFFLLIWALTSLGFFALATSMSKHQKQIFDTELNPAKTQLATILGWVLLILALILCLFAGTISNMISYWLGSLTFAALVVALSLSYLESKIKMIVSICAVIAVISGIICLI